MSTLTPEMNKIIEESVLKRTSEIENTYKGKFEELKNQMYSQMKMYMSESVVKNSIVSPELQAESNTYKSIVEAVIGALKDSGVLNKQSNNVAVDESVVGIITEQTSIITEQSSKIKELKMKIKLHEMISSHLGGMDKNIINEAIKKFQGEDIPEDELLDKLVEFVNKRKSGSKSVQFESINDEIDNVNNILEGNSNKGGFAPSKKISIKGLKARVVTESTAMRGSEVTEESSQGSEADGFLQEFGHLIPR